MSASAIEIVNVTRSFGEVQALKGINLRIAAGEFFSLLGPSGCGKTTLLRMIAGLDQPTSGQVFIGGNEMSATPPDKRPVNMVFQSYALFPHMTVFDNVAFGLRIGNKVPRSEVSGRVERALELVRLPHVSKRFPRELSGGQQQRIAFARAIVNEPLVLLLDEPLSALDPRIREEMQTELARFKRELGITFVMVTHDQSEAFALSDRIAVFNHGKIEQVGTPQEIYEQPQSAFVADFIGHTNILKGTVSASSDAGIAVTINDNLQLAGVAEGSPGFSEGDQVVVWIRAHAIELAANGAKTGEAGNGAVNAIEAEVLHSSYQGFSAELTLSSGGQLLTATVDADDLKNGIPSAGQRVSVSIAVADTHVISA